ncbi:hypothetical protein L1987_25091 [Smallanthus sonchifolius]|uniref:Uncharacterized protein n=1 Tax=Smallanthus sonchifolius TaxID=185202 RepID=A0ACB9IM13_9ASTR|nr:hypothetical protein L1987_25091 [Smallanthus sonchifolius]
MFLIQVTSCLIFLLRLQEVSYSNGSMTPFKLKKISKIPENNDRIGKFGEMMIEMLPQDLSFTIFVPSEFAFERDLRLRIDNSLAGEKENDTYAIRTTCIELCGCPMGNYLRKGEMVIHVMDGVIMEAEFEQSVRSDDGDEE